MTERELEEILSHDQWEGNHGDDGIVFALVAALLAGTGLTLGAMLLHLYR